MSYLTALSPLAAIALLLATASCVADHMDSVPVATPMRATASLQPAGQETLEMHRMFDAAKRAAGSSELPTQF
jgi:hypothetical protein